MTKLRIIELLLIHPRPRESAYQPHIANEEEGGPFLRLPRGDKNLHFKALPFSIIPDVYEEELLLVVVTLPTDFTARRAFFSLAKLPLSWPALQSCLFALVDLAF